MGLEGGGRLLNLHFLLYLLSFIYQGLEDFVVDLCDSEGVFNHVFRLCVELRREFDESETDEIRCDQQRLV